MQTEIIERAQEQDYMQLEAQDQQDSAMMLNAKTMNQIFKLAKIYASSAFVPSAYRGKPEDCFVAMELAMRMNVSPTFVMQQLYVVEGRPAWSGQAALALIRNSGKYVDIHYVMSGEPNTMTWGCCLQAVKVSTGETVTGSVVSMQLAKDEGWLDKRGSKWKTMPEQMLKYRAAAFFARSECPEVLMGFQTADEVRDISRNDAEQRKITISLDKNEEEKQ